MLPSFSEMAESLQDDDDDGKSADESTLPSLDGTCSHSVTLANNSANYTFENCSVLEEDNDDDDDNAYACYSYRCFDRMLRNLLCRDDWWNATLWCNSTVVDNTSTIVDTTSVSNSSADNTVVNNDYIVNDDGIIVAISRIEKEDAHGYKSDEGNKNRDTVTVATKALAATASLPTLEPLPQILPNDLSDDDDEQQQDGNGDRDGDDREEERPNRRGAHQERGIASTTAAAASSSPTISLLASGLALALLALSLRSSPIGSGGRDRRRRGRDRHWKHQQEQESSEKTYDANNNDDNDSDNDNDNGIPNLPRDNVVSTTSSSIADQPIATAGAANDSINRYRDRNCNRTDSTTSSTKEDVPSIITIASANTYPSMDNSDSKLKSQNNKSNSNGNGNNNNNNNKSNNILSRIHLLRQKQKRRRKPKPKLLWVEEVSYASTIELEELSSTLLSVEKTKTKEKRKQAAANTKKTTSIATSSTKRPTATPAATNKRNTKKVGGRRILRLRSVEETYSTPDHIHVS